MLKLKKKASTDTSWKTWRLCLPVFAAIQIGLIGCGGTQVAAVAAHGTSTSVAEAPTPATTAPTSTTSTATSGANVTPATVIPSSYFGLTVQESNVTADLQYATTRSWDAIPGPDWADSNPSAGVYNFANLDLFIAANEPSANNGLTQARDMIYTLGRTPQWASSNPTATTPYGDGQCAPPSSLTYWDDYLTAVVTHAAGRIKYWELWNEPQNTSYYCGDIPTLVTMAQHAQTIIKSIDPDAILISPGMAGGTEGPVWLNTFLADGGATAVDAIGFHGYWDQTAEDLVTEIGQYQAVMATNGVSSLPMWDTEGSGKQMPSWELQSAFLAKYYLLHWSMGIQRFVWYGYDTTPEWGQLWTAAGGDNESATAFAQTYDWMVGATMSSPCAMDSNSNWTCQFTRSNYESMALWNSTQSASYTVPSQFVQYRDMLGVVHPIVNNTVTAGNDPILVETSATESTTLSFATIAPKTYGNPSFLVFATSASNGAITYSVESGPASISGSTVTLTGAGAAVLKASQAASGNYVASTATASVSIAPEAPTISMNPIANQTYGAAPLSLAISSVSSGAVSYQVVSGPASVSGSTLTLTGAGTVSLSSSQAPSGNYAAATATTSFTVAPELPTISFPAYTGLNYGNAPVQLSLETPSKGAITYQLISGPATLSGSTLTLTGAGTIWLGATQAAASPYTAAKAKTSFSVGASAPTLSIDAIPSTTFGSVAWARLSSNSDGAVTYSVLSGNATVSANAITPTSVGTVVIQATQAALGKYTSGTATTSFTVVPEKTTLSFASVPTTTYGAAPFTVSATSVSGGAVTYSVIQGTATVSGSTVTINSVGTVRLQATQAASGNYAAATATTVFDVVQAAPTLTFVPIANQTLGSSSFVVKANSPSSGYIYYTVVSGPAIVQHGDQVTVSGAGTVVLQALQLQEGNYSSATTTASFQVVSTSAALSAPDWSHSEPSPLEPTSNPMGGASE